MGTGVQRALDALEALERARLERALWALYELALPDRLMGCACAMATREVAAWRRARDLPPNDAVIPLDPQTGEAFTDRALREAIAGAISAALAAEPFPGKEGADDDEGA